ncbi:MAG: hypothetical protein ACOX25_11880 [Caldicoprobacterales bacterium]|jgi:hypothetical protein
MTDGRYQRDNKPSRSKAIALSGIFLALTVLVLYAESLVPTGRLSLYALSSLFVSVIVIEAGIQAGWLFYLGSSLLAFIAVPDKLGLFPYYTFFGLYGIIKYYTEKAAGRVAEYLMKYAFFNLSLVLTWLLARAVLLGNLEVKLPLWIVIIGLESAFIIYDLVYTLFIQTYRERIRKVLGL